MSDAARGARFEALFREVYEPLQWYARRRTDATTADDVVAEALTVLWRRLDEVPDGMALPWSYGVARRCLANARRGDARREQLTDRLVAERTGMSTNVDPAVDALDDAMGELPSDDRELLHLWAWEGLAPREIALVLGVSANAVSIRLHRAKTELKKRLAGKDLPAAGHMRGGDTPTTRVEEAT
ncbi:MAG TPA: sigma-70 family RNA polymerase sigma factor [Ilumatobacteraceae bacterium]|nr:sigma-70 family RNA polymerase sigma factor [Ilumatobacteraceae bacterium]